MIRLLPAATAATAALALLLPTGASATVTRTAITTPSEPLYAAYRFAAPEAVFSVSGTSDGTTGDMLALRCEPGFGGRLSEPIRVAADGSFTTTASMTAIGSSPCRLRAVPAGHAGDELAAFEPRLVALTAYAPEARVTPVRGSVELRPFSFDVYTGHRHGIANVRPSDDGGLREVFSLLPDTLARTPSWALAAYLLPDAADPRTPVEVDGAASYGGRLIPRLDFDGAGPQDRSAPAGYTGVQSAVTVDPQSGDVTVLESVPIVHCSGTDRPDPLPAECMSVRPSGIRHERTYRFTREHRVIAVRDSWISSDERAHRVRVVMTHSALTDPPSLWRLPAEPELSPAGGELRHPTGPGTVAHRAESGALAAGAIAFDPAPAEFSFPFNNRLREVSLLEVPAGAVVEVRRTFAHAPTVAGVEQLLPPPAPVPQLAPGPAPAEPGGGGRELKPTGPRPEASRERSRPYRPCVVPRVRRGATVAAARRAIATAGCRSKGPLRKVRSRVRRGRVVTLTPRARSVRAPGAVVTITVSRGRAI
ncbi:hypothetical protein VSS74_29045 [Conexibacter stalactiti]|uniref:PASTA domain-containing protein n=1 Tax=Conexibacter stalactiti TaxID=1940611 RepID=A0ABU4HYN3_9ACTN|nr:hypothetical protein [Conexibacter stalactiti]MDW5598442.1 hypothetical protein [Conexibacter stalactiti]MEC5039084.1 hypothetical protein [Conexibacter stalactiti]